MILKLCASILPILSKIGALFIWMDPYLAHLVFTLYYTNWSPLQCQKRFHLLCQKVRQRISVIPENWHFNSRFVLKTTKTPVFVFITEIL